MLQLFLSFSPSSTSRSRFLCIFSFSSIITSLPSIFYSCPPTISSWTRLHSSPPIFSSSPPIFTSPPSLFSTTSSFCFSLLIVWFTSENNTALLFTKNKLDEWLNHWMNNIDRRSRCFNYHTSDNNINIPIKPIN